MRTLIYAGFLIVLVPPFVSADSLSESAAEIVENAKQECERLDNGEFYASDTAIRLQDFTGDGSGEELIDASQFACSTAASLWGGSGGTCWCRQLQWSFRSNQTGGVVLERATHHRRRGGFANFQHAESN